MKRELKWPARLLIVIWVFAAGGCRTPKTADLPTRPITGPPSTNTPAAPTATVTAVSEQAITVVEQPEPSATPLLADTLPPPTRTPRPTRTPIPTLAGNPDCPVSPADTDFWSEIGDTAVAGEFPVWITLAGRGALSEGRVLPPASGELQFDRGQDGKVLVFVDRSVAGDLIIAGRQLDGDNVVYFPVFWEDIDWIDNTTLQLLKVPSDTKVIPSAQNYSRQPNPQGKAHHGTSMLFISPGCYQITMSIADYTVEVVIELIDTDE